MSGYQPPEMLDPAAGGITRAAELLRQERLVAIPTETVYGLAARADSAAAVAAIYRAKGRPDFNPLIVHVASPAMARTLARFDARADALVERFWPGPLTLVVPAAAGLPIVPAVTAGLPTIALRSPAHPVARRLLEALDLPVAAPSANRSGAVSPTRASHVLSSLRAGIAGVLDGGPCANGLESTIVALRENGVWQLLRPGPVGESEIAALLGAAMPLRHAAVEAPGQLARHYSPGKPVRLDAQTADEDEVLIGFGAIEGALSLSPAGDAAEAAARLYACLHEAVEAPEPRIAVAPIPGEGMAAAIRDRLRRAAA